MFVRIRVVTGRFVAGWFEELRAVFVRVGSRRREVGVVGESSVHGFREVHSLMLKRGEGD